MNVLDVWGELYCYLITFGGNAPKGWAIAFWSLCALAGILAVEQNTRSEISAPLCAGIVCLMLSVAVGLC